MAAKKKNQEKKTVRLKYQFTIDEILDLAREQSKAAQKITELQEEKDASSKSYGARIKTEESRIQEIANMVTSGYEFRDTAVIVHYNTPTKGKKTLKDPNTGKVIEIRTMEAPDYQADLRLGDAKGVKAAPEKTPERPEEEKKTAAAQASAIAKGAKAEGKKAAAKKKAPAKHEKGSF